MGNELLKYLNILTHLNRASKSGEKAPHKPILLLSVIESIALGEIRENKIEITAELIARFRDNWSRLVSNDVFNPNFSLPFFHLGHDKFWHLKTYLGKEILITSSKSIKSFAQLKECVEYAYFDDALFEILLEPKAREQIYQILLAKYFNGHGNIQKQGGLFEILANQILNDTSKEYQRLIEKADEEEVFVRCGVFKKVVPKIYDYSCCISGMRVISGFDIQMVDACHIVPFSVSHDDTITNGISLSPNFHRAFDRGLISLNEDYRVIVSNSFTESASNFALKSFEGKRILLPSEKHHLPSIENIKWHNEKIFKN
jgi:putative restriction endonuclease